MRRQNQSNAAAQQDATYLFGSTMRRPTRLAFGLTPLIEELEMRGHEIAPLLEHAGIPRFALVEPSYRIRFEQELAFIQSAIEKLRGPAVGISIGQRYHLPLFGVLGLAASCAPTIREMFRTVPTFPALAWGSIELSAWRAGDYEYVAFHENQEVGECAAFFVERDTAATITLIRKVLGEQINPSHVRFRFPAPAKTKPYTDFFGCDVSFNDTVNQIWFEREIWETIPPQANAMSYRFYTNQCRQLSEVMHAPLSYADIVTSRLRIATPIPQLDELVASLSLTKRTLQRRLRDENTNFADLLAKIRLERSKDLMRRSGMQLDEIAYCLGFKEASVFSRAFKSWTGMAPQIFRNQIAPKVGSLS